jgi:hypothetical protein
LELALLDPWSSTLLRYFEEINGPLAETIADKDAARITVEIVDGLLRPREELLAERFPHSERFESESPDYARHILDEYLTIKSLHEVPGLVDRAMRLTRLSPCSICFDANELIRF